MKDEAGRILKGELPGSEKFLLIQTLREMKKGEIGVDNQYCSICLEQWEKTYQK